MFIPPVKTIWTNLKHLRFWVMGSHGFLEFLFPSDWTAEDVRLAKKAFENYYNVSYDEYQTRVSEILSGDSKTKDADLTHLHDQLQIAYDPRSLRK